MDVQLEILQGRLKQDNKPADENRFAIGLRKFVIGSDPTCHMVCKSRTISDRHCLILIEDERVLVRDLNSRAGTFINEVPVEGTQLLNDRDKLRIGRLEFRLCITGTSPARAPSSSQDSVDHHDPQTSDTVVGSNTVDTLITDVLQSEDEAARQARYADPSARYFRTDPLPSTTPAEAAPEQHQQKERSHKKSVGKLPPPPPITADDTVSAAEQALDELFHPSKGLGRR